MTPKESLELLVRSIINKSSCGKLTKVEHEAANILRKYLEETLKS